MELKKRGVESGYKYADEKDGEDMKDWYKNGRILSIRSDSVDYEYLLVSANNPEYLINNYKLNYKAYMAGDAEYREEYEILKYEDAGIVIIRENMGLLQLGLEKEKIRIIRAEREKYINITLSKRIVEEYKLDILSGVEAKYQARFGEILEGKEAYEKYLKKTEEIRLKAILYKNAAKR